MFDIGFWEIILISVLGLIVLGPERLPTAIRSVVSWVNTVKNMANSVKGEITHELKLHEMNENMIKATKQGLNSLDPELQKSIDEMKQAAKDVTHPYQDDNKIQPEQASDENEHGTRTATQDKSE